MVLAELSMIFGSALLPLLVVLGGLVMIYETFKILFHYILRSIRKGRSDAWDEIEKEFL